MKRLITSCLAIGLCFTSALKASVREDLDAAALRYFIENSNPRSGMVRDSALDFGFTPNDNFFRRASISGTGFGLAVISNAAMRGMVSRKAAENYVWRVLNFVNLKVPRHRGWFVHFIDWETGANYNDSEYSTMDTALFIAGALYAGEVFPGKISRLAHKLYEDVDFIDMMTNGGALPDKRTLSMAFDAGVGYTESQWNNYAEEMLLLVLGLGHPTNPLPPEAWTAWHRQGLLLPSGATLIGYDKPLFTHQYSQLFIDFRKFEDGTINYYMNGLLGSNFNRETCLNDQRYQTFRSGFWGLSAGGSPDGYSAFTPLVYNGTVCIDCTLASAMYLPQDLMAAADEWRSGAYGPKIWGRYGFIDSLNLDRDWFDQEVYAITVGPVFLALANADDSTSLWTLFNQIPEIQIALKKASDTKELLAQAK